MLVEEPGSVVAEGGALPQRW
jgi:hypothetical protein